MKPKPLNLEDFEDWLKRLVKQMECDLLKGETVTNSKPLNLEDFEDWLKWLGEQMECDLSKVKDVIVNEVTHCIKEACDFYLRYKNRPAVLIWERPEYDKELKELFEIKPDEHANRIVTEIDIFMPNKEKYNDWLFKTAFKDVLKVKP